MMSNNKILTVSYGTFSCTLEGFDDSFGMMKVIAEYFRDLAQEDRYFGAEPPQPDADLLAKMAEQELARRVEGKSDANGVHLRAASAAAAVAPAALSAAEPAPQAAPAPSAPVSQDGSEQQPEFHEEADQVAQADDTAHQDVDLTAAQQHIVEETALDTHDGEMAASSISASASMTFDADDQTIDEPADLPVMTSVPEILDAEPVEAEAAQEFDGSIASKLQRIRAVVAKNQSERGAYSEDEHAEEFMVSAEETEDEPADAFAAEPFEADFESKDLAFAVSQNEEIEDESAGFDGVDAIASEPAFEDLRTSEDDLTVADVSDETLDEAMDEEVDPSQDDDSALRALLEATSTPDVQSDDTTVFEAEEIEETAATEFGELEEETDEAASGDIDFSAIASELSVMKEDTGSQDLEHEMADEPEPLVLDTPVEEQDLAEEELVEIDEEDLSELESVLNLEDIQITETEDPDDSSAPLARVIKVKKSDLDAAVANGMLEEVDEDDDIDLSALQAAGTTKIEIPEEQIDLSSLELDQEETEFEAHEIDADEDAASESAARLLQEVASSDEDELDRLMAEADQHMSEPESSSRRDAFTQLRAAVVATKSDDKLSEEVSGDASNEDEYRTDLAAAVRPRRPTAQGRKDRGETRPAPLKLVAAQRIDVETSEPVQPRRIATSDLEEVSDTAGSFSEYASTQGARELPELLEAAASYLSFVEGREEFSRPQLMTKVRQVGHEDFTREAGLRSFGILLRSGKIEKIKGGRFTVSQEIGFQPDHREAG